MSRVFLVANSGCKTAFKITRAGVFSNLDHVIEEWLEWLVGISYIGDRPIVNRLMCTIPRQPNIYYTEVDDKEHNARKLPQEIWGSLVEVCVSTHPEQVKLAKIASREIIKKLEREEN